MDMKKSKNKNVHCGELGEKDEKHGKGVKGKMYSN